MKLGLTKEDIVNAYPGSTESDFDFGGNCGSNIIEEEINLQYSKLMLRLGKAKTKNTHIMFLRVPVDEDGNILLEIPPEDPEKVVIHRLPSGVSLDGCCKPKVCDIDEFIRCATKIPFEFLEATEEPEGPLEDTWVIDPELGISEVMVSYKISEEFEITSLKVILRDMVACALGRRLYSSTEDGDWSLVSYYCDSAKEYLDMLGKDWRAPELTGLNVALLPAIFKSYDIQRVS